MIKTNCVECGEGVLVSIAEKNVGRCVSCHKLYGVKGWLLFFCISIAILSPAILIYKFLPAVIKTIPVLMHSPKLLLFTGLQCVLQIVTISFGISAGYNLWRIKPGAVSHAKFCLIVILCSVVANSLIPFFMGLPEEVIDKMLPNIVIGIIQSAIYFAIWYSYLNKSQRVKMTYN